MCKNKAKRVFFEELWSVYQWFFLFIPGRIGHYTRGYFLKFFFHSAGSRVTIKENVEIYHPENLSIGDSSGFGRNNIIDCIGGVKIGNNVRFGPSVMVATMHHAKVGESIVNSTATKEEVNIGNNVWVGFGVIILPGVSIGDNCIIAAGSVVTRNVSKGSTVAGVPAKIISSSDSERKYENS